MDERDRYELKIAGLLHDCGKVTTPVHVVDKATKLQTIFDRIGLVEDGTVAFPLNQQHIADALGLSLVHTNRTLRGLSRLGLHEIKNGRLRLLNTRALARIAEYYDTPPRLMPLL